MVIKLYRQTIECIERLPGNKEDFIYYYQTDWGSVKSYTPGEGKRVVKIEEKEVELES